MNSDIRVRHTKTFHQTIQSILRAGIAALTALVIAAACASPARAVANCGEDVTIDSSQRA